MSLHSRPLLEELSDGLLSRFGLPTDSDAGQSSVPGSVPVPGSGSDPAPSPIHVPSPGSSAGAGCSPSPVILPDGFTRDRVNRVLTAVPELGDFDLRKVLESPYFFS